MVLEPISCAQGGHPTHFHRCTPIATINRFFQLQFPPCMSFHRSVTHLDTKPKDMHSTFAYPTSRQIGCASPIDKSLDRREGNSWNKKRDETIDEYKAPKHATVRSKDWLVSG